MKSNDILYSNGKNDECFTPDYGVVPILEYIPKSWTIWCPCDTEDSNFVKLIRKNGNKVISSHINEDKNFFDYEPQEHWDCIITNTPFTNKRAYFERALDLNKPFALLMTLTIFNDKYPMWSFYERNKQPQLLKFDKRIEFEQVDGKIGNKITFQSGYVCCDFLPKDLVLKKI